MRVMAHLDKYTRQELRRILKETYREYGKTKEHKQLLKEGKKLPPWKDVKIRCHDFRVTFCTTYYEAGIKIKTLQAWMGHADATMIMDIYAKLTEERELQDTTRLDDYTKSRFSA